MNINSAKHFPGEESRKCYPLCRHFRCSKNALVVVTKYFRGRPRKEAVCRWVGDNCSGPECQYAYCEKRALLPDGTCGLSMMQRRHARKDMLREIEEADLGIDVKEIVKKRFGKREFTEL